MSEMGKAILEGLAGLPDDFDLTFSVKAGIAKRALARSNGGPDWLSTVQAAQIIGGSARMWRDWAAQERIEGAKRDQGGNWRLPNAAARAWFDSWLSGDTEGSDTPPSQNNSSPGRKRRGPRKTPPHP